MFTMKKSLELLSTARMAVLFGMPLEWAVENILTEDK